MDGRSIETKPLMCQIFIDTYSNLLYKAGRKQEAIQWEGKATIMAKEAKDDHLKEIENNLGENETR